MLQYMQYMEMQQEIQHSVESEPAAIHAIHGIHGNITDETGNTCVHVDTVSDGEIHVEMQKEGMKKERSKQGKTNIETTTQQTQGSHFS